MTSHFRAISLTVNGEEEVRETVVLRTSLVYFPRERLGLTGRNCCRKAACPTASKSGRTCWATTAAASGIRRSSMRWRQWRERGQWASRTVIALFHLPLEGGGRPAPAGREGVTALPHMPRRRHLLRCRHPTPDRLRR